MKKKYIYYFLSNVNMLAVNSSHDCPIADCCSTDMLSMLQQSDIGQMLIIMWVDAFLGFNVQDHFQCQND